MSDNLAGYYERLTRGKIPCFLQMPDGWLDLPADHPLWINTVHLLPGSFNPLHDGHREIFNGIRKGEDWRWYEGTRRVARFFELSLLRRDKGYLPLPELAERLRQFVGYAPVLVTNCPRMHQKTGLFRGVDVQFHIGLDTATRLLEDEGHYGVQGIAARFHVYPRNEQDLLSVCATPPLNFQAGHLDRQFAHLSSTALREGR